LGKDRKWISWGYVAYAASLGRCLHVCYAAGLFVAVVSIGSTVFVMFVKWENVDVFLI